MVNFSIKEYPELFTVTDYKNLLAYVREHFMIEVSKQRINILYITPYYNPELNKGIVDYELSNYSGGIYLPDMDMPYPNGCITITFY
jgi:hypothetical protein